MYIPDVQVCSLLVQVQVALPVRVQAPSTSVFILTKIKSARRDSCTSDAIPTAAGRQDEDPLVADARLTPHPTQNNPYKCAKIKRKTIGVQTP
mgnify:CR=1 FL=1